jgi:hypothetical protein
MSELPFIDINSSPEVLRAYALEHFGKKISGAAREDTVRDRFAAIYFEETGKQLVPEVEEAPQPKKREPVAATIIVQDDPNDPSPVCGAVNFVAYRIKRNTEVRVSMPILRSLQCAVKTVYNPDTMEPREALQYPFSILEYHYEG